MTNQERIQRASAAKLRAHNRKPIDDVGGIVSVLIPYGVYDKMYLNRTIESVQQTAGGEIEVLSLFDKNDEGHRVLTNRMAYRAKGKYLFRLDAHCAMSPEWDLRMKASCKPNTVVTAILDRLDESDWSFCGMEHGMVVLNSRMRNVYSNKVIPFGDRQLEEPSMGIAGCAYMIQKETFFDGDMLDENLGKWGAAGLELALKTWLTGGQVVTRTDVECAHLFRPDKKTPFQVDIKKMEDAYIKLGRMWRDYQGKGQTRPLHWLVEKFAAYIPELNTTQPE